MPGALLASSRVVATVAAESKVGVVIGGKETKVGVETKADRETKVGTETRVLGVERLLLRRLVSGLGEEVGVETKLVVEAKLIWLKEAVGVKMAGW